jgi:transposase
VDVLIERCAGIDIGKHEVVACVRTPGPGGRGRRKQTRTFIAFTSALQEMADWFTAERVTDIAMEVTGSYWKPVWYLLGTPVPPGACQRPAREDSARPQK